MIGLRLYKTLHRTVFRRKFSTQTAIPNIELLKNSLEARGKLDLLKKLEQNETLNPKELPNLIHPSVLTYGETPKIIEEVNQMPQFDGAEPATFHDICHKLNILRMDVGQFAGSRSYYLMDDLADLETALILYAVNYLKERNFELVSVPDILPASVIEACGMQVYGDRNQVYKLSNRGDGTDLCLSGTSEMALANFVSNKIFKESELPKRFMAVSRCYRAEASTLEEERGIYRVHQFNKVEMFGVSAPSFSSDFLEEFRAIQTDLFRRLGLHFKVLDMPPHELGAPAYRKYDMEAWMPGRKMYGELSSCSNCTDYQSSRLNIQVQQENGELTWAHTINGTAAAIPRLLIAIIESFQNVKKQFVTIPEVLQPFMGKDKIQKKKGLPETKLVKDISPEALVKEVI